MVKMANMTNKGNMANKVNMANKGNKADEISVIQKKRQEYGRHRQRRGCETAGEVQAEAR